MTEKQFIKQYFQNKKNTLNEDVINTVVDVGSKALDVIDVDPLLRFGKELVKYSLSKGASDVAEKGKFSLNFGKENQDISGSKRKTKAEKTPRNNKLKLRGMILRNGNLHLKYFLIHYTIYIKEKKGKINNTIINSLYDELENSRFVSPVTGEKFNASGIITTNSIINEEKINSKNFINMMTELFITDTSLYQSLYNIIEEVLKGTTLIDQTDINEIFDKFYKTKTVKYKIGS